MLTVRQLIAHLQNFQQDQPVMVKVYGCGQTHHEHVELSAVREVSVQSAGGPIAEIDASYN